MRYLPVSDILRILTAVFREILDEPDLVLRDDLTADDLKSWDSLNHIDLIAAVEREFGIRFTTWEVLAINKVGDLVELTQDKLNARK